MDKLTPLIETLRNYINDKKEKYLMVKNTFMQLDLESIRDIYNNIVEENPSIIGKQMNILQTEQLFNKFFLLGESGSGKTTALKYLCYRKLQALSNKDFIHDSDKVPIFIELSMFDTIHRKFWIIESIKNEFHPYIKDSHNTVLYLLERGAFLLIFDGLNEVPKRFIRKAIKEIKELLIKYPKNKFIISSRTLEYSEYFNLKNMIIKKTKIV